jgi:hypothetical protein
MASFSGHLAQFSVFTRCYTVAYEGLEYSLLCVDRTVGTTGGLFKRRHVRNECC